MRVQLTIEWEAGGSTVKEFPSKTDAINWLAMDCYDGKPMATVNIVPLEPEPLP